MRNKKKNTKAMQASSFEVMLVKGKQKFPYSHKVRFSSSDSVGSVAQRILKGLVLCKL